MSKKVIKTVQTRGPNPNVWFDIGAHSFEIPKGESTIAGQVLNFRVPWYIKILNKFRWLLGLSAIVRTEVTVEIDTEDDQILKETKSE